MSSDATWQGYIDSCLMDTGKIANAAIFGFNGSCWASSSDFTPSSKEVETLKKAFQDPSDVQASGLYIAGVKYFVLQVTPRSIYGKKGAEGVICVKTTLTIIIATYGKNHVPGESTNVVEQLADYLLSVNF